MRKNLLLLIIFILFTGQLFAQKQVTGQVLDEAGDPMPGVNVVVKGTTQGTITDMNGNFTLAGVTSESVLVFSFIGNVPQEIAVGELVYFDVTLKAEATELDEVVVVGYGEVKRANLVGAVVDVSAREIEEIPATNLSTLLEGRLAGVKVGQSSGNPGAATSFEIRVTGTWNQETPIFVIDGIVYEDMDRFNMLDPSEIESISVLKDASAAVYGAKSAGGVVIVKTKRGSEGKPTITYSGSYGFSKAAEFPEMLSAYDQATLINDRLKLEYPTNYEDQTQYYTEDELEYFRNTDYDWLEEAWKSSYVTRHTMNIQGGSEKVRYFGGGSYYYETGNFDNLYVEKYTLRLGVDADITKDLTASLTLSSGDKKYQRPYNKLDTEGDHLRGTFEALLTTPKWIPPYIDGKPVGQGGMIASHPLEVGEIGSYQRNRGSDYDVTASLEYRMPFIKGMKANFSYTYLQGNEDSKQYRVPYTLYRFSTEGGHSHIFTPESEVIGNPVLIENGDRLAYNYAYNKNYQINLSLSWARTFGKHDISALAVYEQSEKEDYGFTAYRENMLIAGYERLNGFVDTADATSDDAGNSASLGSIGRINYTYADKYIIETAFRYEGSTKFAPGERWGFFPSVAVGWRISEESFFKDNISFINYMKIRASAGLVGNDKGVDDREWELSYVTTGGAYLGGTGVTNALETRNNSIVLTGVTWEKTRAYNGGMDMRFLEDFSLSFDMFYKYTYDILSENKSSLPAPAGIDEMPKQNYGVAEAWGGESEVGYDKKIVSDLYLHLSANMGFTRARVLKKDQNPTVIGTWKDEIGIMDNGEVGYIATGIIRTQEEADALIEQGWTIFGEDPEPGMMNYQDLGSANYSDSLDGKIDGNDQRILEQYTNAPLNYGFQIGFSFRNFEVATNFKGSCGNMLLMEGEAFEWVEKSGYLLTDNHLAFWKDHWTEENPDAEFPRVYENQASENSTFWFRKGHTLRLTTITVTYNVPKKYTEQYKIPPIAFNFTGRNIWTIINPYEYKDPAVSKFNGYPLLRTYIFGIKITL